MSMTNPSPLVVNDGTLTINSDSAQGTVLADQLERLTGGAPVVVRNATQTADGARVAGTASLLNVTDMPVVVKAATGPDGAAAFTARFTLIEGEPGPNPWRFSRSFPEMPALYTGSERVHLLDRLQLSDAAFVLAASAGADEVTGAPLQAGLNFVARCAPTGIVGLLGSVLDGGPLLLYGPVVVPKPTELTLPMPRTSRLKFPWQLPAPAPGIHLRADLGVDKQLGDKLRLHDAGLRIYCPASSAWAEANPTYPPRLAAAAKLDVPSAELSLDLTALGLDSPDSLTLYGGFEGVTLARLAQLLDVSGADDLAAQLPADVQAALATLSSLTLDALTLRLGAGFTVKGVGVAVGLPGVNTNVLPGLNVRRLTADFSIGRPFAPQRSLSVTLGGRVDFAGAPFDIEIELPEASARARMRDDARVPLSAVFREFGLPAPPDLTVNEMQLGASADGSLSLAAAMAEQPPWTLDLGPAPLTFSDVRVVASRPAAGAAAADLGGVLALGNELKLEAAYRTPGEFVMRGELPDVRLRELIGKLTGQPDALPGDFDPAFTDSAVLIQKTGPGLVFQLATTTEGLGTAAFEARRTGGAQNAWGFAAGVAPAGVGLSGLPGLGALKPFEDAFKLDELVVVAASFDDPGFKFPALAAFNSPNLNAGDLTLPAQAGGVVRGLNVYARWRPDAASREQQLLTKLLGLGTSLGVTLQVGTGPSRESRLYVSLDTRIQGHPFSCKFGGQMKGGQVGLFLTGTLQTTIQKQPVRFDATTLFVANGALISGSMLGSVKFEGLTLSNLALVVGVNWEGVPSLGIAATLADVRFRSALAFFFDSTDPSRSLLSGAVSDLTLRDVLVSLAGSATPSKDLDAALSKVALVGTSSFKIDASASTALDNLQVGDVSAAFNKVGVRLPNASSQVLLNVGKPGSRWFITDLSRMLHYELVKEAQGVAVSLNPQLYCVPQPTSIGALRFEQGTFINTGLKILNFDAEAKVLVKPGTGVSVEGQMKRVVIGTEALFSVESDGGGGKGPRVSAATFRQPAVPEPARREPHFMLNGSLSLLGIKRAVVAGLDSRGFSFNLKDSLAPGFTYDLSGRFGGPTELAAGGKLSVGVGTLDLGALGKVNLQTGVNGELDVGVSGANAWAKFNGGFQFAGEQFTLPAVSLDVRAASLPGLPKQLADLAAAALVNALKPQPAKWLKAARAGLIVGAQEAGKVLRTVYNLGSEQAAQVLRGAGYAAGEVGGLLRTAYGVTPQQAASLLRGAGYAAQEVGTFLKANAPAAAATTMPFAGQLAQLTFVTTSLKGAGFPVNEVGGFVKDTFGLGPEQLKGVLESAGFPAAQVKGYFVSLGGSFKDFAAGVAGALDPRRW